MAILTRFYRSAWVIWIPTATLLIFPLGGHGAAPDGFDDSFRMTTMRVDYFHSGNAVEEHVAQCQVVSDGPWAGSRTRLIDDLNLGKYYFEIRDLRTNHVIYSRGFSSVYGEWETTADAKHRWGTFHESLRFPWPRQPVQVILKKRRSDQLWQEIWTTRIDPDSRFVTPADQPPLGKVWNVFENGRPENKVDLLILGDGYTAEELHAFHVQTRHLVTQLFQEEPFRTRKQDFNVRAIDLPAGQSGVSRPHADVFRRSPLGARYSVFDSERYVLTRDNRKLRDVASAAPYDFLVILVNERTYGGGGIYQDQTTAAAGSAFAEYLFMHELGHHFAGLGDEYYTSDVAYETDTADQPEPWEPNLTALRDKQGLKWQALVSPSVPVPTPWNKEQYEQKSEAFQEQRRQLRSAGAPEEQLEALFEKEREVMTDLLSSAADAGKVGAFEGAGYQAHGLYRPTTDCVMFTRNEVGFCPVCQHAILRVIDQYSR